MILRKTVGKEEAGLRLDEAAPRLFPQLSRTAVRRIIDWGGCTLAGAMVRVASRTVNEGDEIVVGVMEAEHYKDVYLLAPEELLYEDVGFIAVSKPAGINAQRTPYQLKGTLEHAVSRFFADRGIAVGEPVRIVHRLDRGTSGVVVFPKTKRDAAYVSDLFQRGEVEKVYWALVTGAPPAEWRVEGLMAKIASATYGMASPGRESRSAFRVIAAGENGALVECRPETGRTHQLRVHLSHSGHPIVGDKTYGGDPAPRLMLHCRYMGFDAGERRVEATAPVDGQFRDICARYGVVIDGG